VFNCSQSLQRRTFVDQGVLMVVGHKARRWKHGCPLSALIGDPLLSPHYTPNRSGVEYPARSPLGRIMSQRYFTVVGLLGTDYGLGKGSAINIAYTMRATKYSRAIPTSENQTNLKLGLLRLYLGLLSKYKSQIDSPTDARNASVPVWPVRCVYAR